MDDSESHGNFLELSKLNMELLLDLPLIHIDMLMLALDDFALVEHKLDDYRSIKVSIIT